VRTWGVKQTTIDQFSELWSFKTVHKKSQEHLQKKWFQALITSSSGGSRTPDTRIMIPNPEFPNPLSDSEKQQAENGVYTPVYTNDSDLAEIVNSWEGLLHETRMVISYLVKTHRMV